MHDSSPLYIYRLENCKMISQWATPLRFRPICFLVRGPSGFLRPFQTYSYSLLRPFNPSCWLDPIQRQRQSIRPSLRVRGGGWPPGGVAPAAAAMESTTKVQQRIMNQPIVSYPSAAFSCAPVRSSHFRRYGSWNVVSGRKRAFRTGSSSRRISGLRAASSWVVLACFVQMAKF